MTHLMQRPFILISKESIPASRYVQSIWRIGATWGRWRGESW